MKGSGNTCSAVLLAVSFSAVASAAERPIAVDNSTIRIHVRKAGLFSAAGHEHWVAAPIAQGSVDEGEPPRVAFTVSANRLKVEPDTSLSADDQAKVQQTMQEKVLESARYSEISFRSTSVAKTASDTWNVKGILALHGRSNPVSATVHKTQSKYVGHCRIKQTDFGIQPVTAGGGLVKVKNELDIEFAIAVARPAAEMTFGVSGHDSMPRAYRLFWGARTTADDQVALRENETFYRLFNLMEKRAAKR